MRSRLNYFLFIRSQSNCVFFLSVNCAIRIHKNRYRYRITTELPTQFLLIDRFRYDQQQQKIAFSHSDTSNSSAHRTWYMCTVYACFWHRTVKQMSTVVGFFNFFFNSFAWMTIGCVCCVYAIWPYDLLIGNIGKWAMRGGNGL